MFILFRFNFVGKFFITRVTLLKLLLQQFYCLIAICLPLPNGPWSIISLLSSLHLSGKEQVIVTPHKDKNSQIQRLPVIFHTRKVSLPFTYTKSEIIWIGFTLNERNSIHTKFTLNELNWIQNRDFAQKRSKTVFFPRHKDCVCLEARNYFGTYSFRREKKLFTSTARVLLMAGLPQDRKQG